MKKLLFTIGILALTTNAFGMNMKQSADLLKQSLEAIKSDSIITLKKDEATKKFKTTITNLKKVPLEIQSITLIMGPARNKFKSIELIYEKGKRAIYISRDLRNNRTRMLALINKIKKTVKERL